MLTTLYWSISSPPILECARVTSSAAAGLNTPAFGNVFGTLEEALDYARSH
ncbi:MAG TPA: hypothetical protein VHP83_05095 [Aggregatilineaceae bacterium]|nr:hypothetical protein [Aggregatilineaceae bacterium]